MSTRNAYADLGLKSPEEHALEAKLVRQIAAALKDEGLTQTAVARPTSASSLTERLMRRTWKSWSARSLPRAPSRRSSR